MQLLKISPLLFIAWIFSACSGTRVPTYAYENSTQLSQTSSDEERKMVYKASLTLIVEDVWAVNPKLQELAKEFGGYIHQSGTEYIIMRVKNDFLEESLKKIQTLGKVRNQRITGLDIGQNYENTNIRLKNALKLRDRYLELLEKANEVEDILKIERELERLNTLIDTLENEKQKMDSEAALANISIQLQKKVKPGPVGYLFVGLYKSVSWLFVRK